MPNEASTLERGDNIVQSTRKAQQYHKIMHGLEYLVGASLIPW